MYKIYLERALLHFTKKFVHKRQKCVIYIILKTLKSCLGEIIDNTYVNLRLKFILVFLRLVFL
jgi:hypothetical protein